MVKGYALLYGGERANDTTEVIETSDGKVESIAVMLMGFPSIAVGYADKTVIYKFLGGAYTGRRITIRDSGFKSEDDKPMPDNLAALVIQLLEKQERYPDFFLATGRSKEEAYRHHYDYIRKRRGKVAKK